MSENVPQIAVPDSSVSNARLSPKEQEKIPPVFQAVLDRAEKTLGEFKVDKKEIDRIAVVIAAYNAKKLLPETLREIVVQLRQSKLQGEIFVVLNNGGGDTKEFINSDMECAELDRITREIGVNGIIFGKTESLKELSSNSKAVPREITVNKSFASQADGVKLVVIEQREEPDNSGKIRALRDVYEFLKLQNEKTGYCPQFLLAMDAETRLRPVGPKNRKIMIDNCSGLSDMVRLSEGGKNMVGAKLQFVPYDGNGKPDWGERRPPMQEAISIMHGLKGYEWLPGGGTLGGFPEMVSILSSISQQLPGTRIEDVLTTVVAKALGIETIVDTQVVHTNKCPNEGEQKEVIAQIERWLKGAEGLKEVTGKPLAEKIIKNVFIRVIAYPFVELLKGRKIEVFHLLQGLPPYLRAGRSAKKEPDDFIGGPASFTGE